MLKRAVSFLASAAALVVLSPAFLLIALCIWAIHGRPIFFRQIRVGRNFQTFMLWKFRTMKTGHPGPSLTADGDPRITWFGRGLRSTHLDELPQLVHILRGQMAFIGPRPEIPEFVDPQLRAWQKLLSVRPGLLDEASLLGRGEALRLARAADPNQEYRERILPAKLAVSLASIPRRSPARDLQLMARTIVAIGRSALAR